MYTVILRDDPSRAFPSASGEVSLLDSRVRWEVRKNAIWRFGRVFLRCSQCSRRVTRLYLPTRGSWLACRTCWGLSYASRQNSYRRTGWSAVLGTIGECQTALAREQRREASRGRQCSRREALAARGL